MTITFLSNDELSPPINWSTLGAPMRRALHDSGVDSIAPFAGGAGRAAYLADARQIRRSDAAVWMQLSARPETPVLARALAARRRSAYVIDPWPYAIPKIAWAARVLRLNPCFVSFEQAIPELRRRAPAVPFIHLPFGVDVDVFHPRPIERDVFAFWMGRRHEPLHEQLETYCQERGLTYVTSQNGSITEPDALGELVSRAKYFVVTTPDVDHPERAGGFSPLVMRYLEGVAGGARLLGTRPRSGELERMGLSDALLDVRPDGADLAEKLDTDRARLADDARTSAITRHVLAEHSWHARATAIRQALES